MNHEPNHVLRGALALWGAAVAAAAVSGAPLNQTTAVQTRPEAAAPAFTFLKAGSEPTPLSEIAADLPAGWMAVSVAGPVTGYVQNQDLTKGLEVKAGAPVRLEPAPEAGVITLALPSDKIALTGLRGKWTQVRVDRPVSGYIHLGPLPAAPTPVPTPAPVDLSTPPAGAGKAAPENTAGADALPRAFEGRFASSSRLLVRWQPYPWELQDAKGSRTAYLDISRLLLTDQAGSYAGHDVEVFGTPKPVAGTRDFVVVVDSLRLK